jgi:hypothetical protein
LSIPKTTIEDLLKLGNINDWVASIQQHMKYEDAAFENLTWSLQFVRKPSGGTSHRDSVKDYEDLKSRKCLIEIKNEKYDNACLARSLVILKAKEEEEDEKAYKAIKERNATYKNAKEAYALCEDAKVSPKDFCSLEDIKKFEEVLKYNVVVYDLQKSRLYTGQAFEKNLYVLLHNQHYTPITTMKSFMGKDYWCHKCLKAYKKTEGHSKCTGIKYLENVVS